jgi:prophage tail gpP-like protein
VTVEAFNTEHTVALTLASSGLELDVWDEYVITLDMLSPGASFTFALWYSRDRATAWEVLRRSVKVGDSVVLSIDGAPQLNGRIDTIDTDADGHGARMMTVTGRDLAGVALDFDADPTINVVGLRLEDALRRVFASVNVPFRMTTADAAREVTTKRASRRTTAVEAAVTSPPVLIPPPTQPSIVALGIASPLGRLVGLRVDPISLARPEDEIAIYRAREAARNAAQQRARVRAQRNKSVIVDEAHPKPGERVWHFAEAIVCRLGMRLWVAPDAANGVTVVADRPDDSQEPTFAFNRVLTDGVNTSPSNNVLRGKESISIRGVPTSVSVYTNTSRGDTTAGRSRAIVQNTRLADDVVTRGFVLRPTPLQPRYIRSERSRVPQRSEQEGERIITDAMASFRTYTATVRGHGQRVDGVDRLFAINTTARVVDSVMSDPDGNALDEVMLMTRVEFRRARVAGTGGSGTQTSVTLVPLGAIDLTPTQT